MGTVMPEDKERSIRDWAIMYLRFTLDDLAGTKKRIFEISYYGAILQAGVVLLTKTFDESHVATCSFFAILLGISPLIAALNIYLVIQGMLSLVELRTKLDYFAENFWPEEIRAIPPRRGNLNLSTSKYLKDLWLNVFLLILPVAGTGFVCWYLFVMAARTCRIWS
jgi:hypothetical protein